MLILICLFLLPNHESRPVLIHARIHIRSLDSHSWMIYPDSPFTHCFLTDKISLRLLGLSSDINPLPYRQCFPSFRPIDWARGAELESFLSLLSYGLPAFDHCFKLVVKRSRRILPIFCYCFENMIPYVLLVSIVSSFLVREGSRAFSFFHHIVESLSRLHKFRVRCDF